MQLVLLLQADCHCYKGPAPSCSFADLSRHWQARGHPAYKAVLHKAVMNVEHPSTVTYVCRQLGEGYWPGAGHRSGAGKLLRPKFLPAGECASSARHSCCTRCEPLGCHPLTLLCPLQFGQTSARRARLLHAMQCFLSQSNALSSFLFA